MFNLRHFIQNFDKIEGFIKIHNKIRFLVLFDYGYCDRICDKN